MLLKDSIRLQVPLEKGTFQDTAAALFTNLPDNLKKCDDFNLFSSRIFKFLKNQAHRPAYLNCISSFIHMNM